MNYHKSVLLQEAIDYLNIKSGQKYIDATLGGGGHTKEILEAGGVVLAIDQDKDAVEFVESKLKNPNLKLRRGNFKDLNILARDAGFEKVSGILFDLGVSSYQLDTPERGFSYLKSGPLDMRMDQSLGVKAADLVNALGKKELYDLFRTQGGEHNAHGITERIISRRKIKPFETTDELSEVLSESYGFKSISDFAKATSGKKVFQALRIAVNDELGSIKEALPKALELLEERGRIVVITFHSLEDRIVKQEFARFEEEGKGKIITKKPVLPSLKEAEENSRSKSAKLRVFERSTSSV
jgi:16S rRNA (cytosine1402-N4)-methyltransferase